MNPTTTRWPLANLKPHPRQHILFTDLDEHAFNDLVEDMRAHGLNHPVEILPDGTIVCGHQRIRAATQLGWTEIDVRLRDDLAAQGDVAVEQHLIADNLHRRHLDKLALGRCYQRLRELERSLPREQRHLNLAGQDLRDVIARKLGCSGRNLDRYLRILRTPKEVQDAFSQGSVSLIQAGKVAGFSLKVQEEIGSQIRDGRPPKEVVKAALKASERPGQREERQRNLAGAVVRTLRTLQDEVDPAVGMTPRVNDLLQRGRKVLDELLAGPLRQTV